MHTFTGNTSSGSAVITSVADTSDIVLGSYLFGSGIPTGAAVASFVTNTSVTMTLNATATATGVTITQGQDMAFSAAPQASWSQSMGLTVNRAVSLAAAPLCALDAVVALTGASVRLLASPVSSFDSVVALSGKTAAFKASPGSAFAAAVALVGSSASFRAAPVSSLSSSVTLNGNTAQFSAIPVSELVASVTMSGASAILHAAPVSAFIASVDLTGASDSHGLSICDVVSDILGMWGIFCRKSAPDFALDAAINIANQSLQLVWNNAEGRTYWTNETLTITLSDGESSQDLGDDIQNVVGPCRLQSSKQPLVPIGTIGELETFSDIYLDGEAADTPLAYHVERMNQSGGDPAKCVFHVNSVIDGADVAFLLEVVKEPPRFLPNDLASCPVVPMPHRYVESLLLPVARYQASAFYLFRMADQKPTIDREYQQAMISLGLADPINPKTGDNKEKGGDA